MIRGVAVILSITCTAGLAIADETTARKLFDDGERAYNLGEFDKAVGLFKQAYEQRPDPVYLFNVAQTYRQMGDCKQAVFFYKRYIALKEQDTKKPLKPERKAELENRIAELEECVKRELASKPPTQLDNGGAETGASPGKTTGAAEAAGEGKPKDEGEATSSAPRVMSVRANFGTSKLGAGNLPTSFQFGGAIVGGYPLAINDKIDVELGAAFSFTPVPYTTSQTPATKGRASLIGIMANAAPSLEIIPKLSARVDLGVGILVIPGLGMEGNPFTIGGAGATGALSVFHLRTALSADYAVTPNIVVTLTPIAFGYSPAPEGFLEEISSLTTLSFFAGVGYRR